MSQMVVLLCKWRCINVNVTFNTHVNTACAQENKRTKNKPKQKTSNSDWLAIVVCVMISPEVETTIWKRHAFKYLFYDWFVIFLWKPLAGLTYDNNQTRCCKTSLRLHLRCIQNWMKRALLSQFLSMRGLLRTLHDMTVLKLHFKTNNNWFALPFLFSFAFRNVYNNEPHFS